MIYDYINLLHGEDIKVRTPYHHGEISASIPVFRWSWNWAINPSVEILFFVTSRNGAVLIRLAPTNFTSCSYTQEWRAELESLGFPSLIHYILGQKHVWLSIMKLKGCVVSTFLKGGNNNYEGRQGAWSTYSHLPEIRNRILWEGSDF